MVTLAETIQGWDEAGTVAEHRQFIHPAGDDREAYEASGMFVFNQLRAVIGDERRQYVLDFGCGDGRVAVPLACYYDDVMGADASQHMLDRLAARAPIPTVLSDGTDDTLPEAAFDAVCCIAVLIHHPYRTGRRILAGLARAVKPGGKVILWLPLYGQPRNATSWDDFTVWTRRQLDDAATAAGLTVEHAIADPSVYTGVPGPYHGELVILRR